MVLTLAYKPLIGGAEIALEQIIKRMDQDYYFDIITLWTNRNVLKQEEGNNFTIYRSGLSLDQSVNLTKTSFKFKIGKLFYPFIALKQAKKLIKQNEYIAVWSIMAAYAGVAGWLIKRRFPKLNFILTLQEGDTASHVIARAGIFAFLIKKVFKSADVIQAISNYLIDFAKAFGSTKPVVVIPNGVDLDLFQSTQNKIIDGKTRLITTSRLVEKNGLTDLIAALTYLDRSVVLDILGSGPLSDDLSNLTKKLNLEARVNFVGSLPQNQTVKYLNQADIFIRPSLSEGLGNSFLEAMAVGLPIIGTPVGGITDFLKDGETGLFCRVSDPKSIASAVIKILSDPNLKSRLILNGKKLVQTTYGWDLIVGRFKAEIFDKLIKQL